MDLSTRTIRWLALTASALAVCGAMACEGGRDDTLARIQAQGFIRAGYAQEPPYAFADASGRVDGEAPEALRHALSAQGADSIRWVRLDFEDLLPALEMGRVDVVAAGLFPTPERRRRARFSRPTFCPGAALAFRAGTPPPAGLDAFASAEGGRLAVVAGSVENRAATLLSVPEERLMTLPDLATGLAAVRGGTADALALTAPTLRHAIRGDSTLDWVAYTPPPQVAEIIEGCSALAFRIADERLAAAVDEGLGGYLGTAVHAGVMDRLEMVPRGVVPEEEDGP